ncbi:MAG: glycosyltransferase [Candidatus Paceibacterota bacterium]
MISIIIPTLNEEKIIAKTLSELKKITVVDHEIIVTDGKSTDNTVVIAKRYTHKVVENISGKRQTIGEGRNMGANVAVGEYLVFMDADVEIPNVNDFFLKIIDDFQKNKKLVAISVYFKVFKDQATLGDKMFFNTINAVYFVMNNIFRIGAAGGDFQMIRADAFRRVGGFDIRLAAGEDNELFSRLSRIGRTRIDSGLYVLHTSRRAHSTGWLVLLATWFGNAMYARFFHRSFSKEWKVIR